MDGFIIVLVRSKVCTRVVSGIEILKNSEKVCPLDILCSSNHNIHKGSCGLCFWAPDPLIDRY